MTQAFDDDLIGGRYRLVRQVGRGGMGTVWQALDELLDRTVAIKQLASPFGTAEERAEQVERIKREAKMAARLDHTGVVRVYDIIDWSGSPAIVMEYIRGRSLKFGSCDVLVGLVRVGFGPPYVAVAPRSGHAPLGSRCAGSARPPIPLNPQASPTIAALLRKKLVLPPVVLYAHGERWLTRRRLVTERSRPRTLWIFVLPPTGSLGAARAVGPGAQRTA